MEYSELTAREKWLVDIIKMNTRVSLNFNIKSDNMDFRNKMQAEHEEYLDQMQADILKHLGTIKEAN